MVRKGGAGARCAFLTTSIPLLTEHPRQLTLRGTHRAEAQGPRKRRRSRVRKRKKKKKKEKKDADEL